MADGSETTEVHKLQAGQQELLKLIAKMEVAQQAQAKLQDEFNLKYKPLLDWLSRSDIFGSIKGRSWASPEKPWEPILTCQHPGGFDPYYGHGVPFDGVQWRCNTCGRQ